VPITEQQIQLATKRINLMIAIIMTAMLFTFLLHVAVQVLFPQKTRQTLKGDQSWLAQSFRAKKIAALFADDHMRS
jgi:uncharacterized protein YycO